MPEIPYASWEAEIKSKSARWIPSVEWAMAYWNGPHFAGCSCDEECSCAEKAVEILTAHIKKLEGR